MLVSDSSCDDDAVIEVFYSL